MSDATHGLRLSCSGDDLQSLLRGLLKMTRQEIFSSKDLTQNPDRGAKLVDEYAGQYLRSWEAVLGKALKDTYDNQWIVGNAFYSNFEDLAKKVRKKEFYVAHITVIKKVLEDMAQWLRILEDRNDASLTRWQANGTLKLFEETATWAIELLQQYADMAGLQFERALHINKIGHHRIIFDTCRDLWYGNFVQDSWATAVMIRQCLEIRLRHCLDIMGLEIDGKQVPLPVTHVLEALTEEDSAQSEVQWHILKKVYGWSNIYVHTGAKDHPWLAGYAMFLLRPLMTGIEEDGGRWSVDNAIKISEAGVERVYDSIITKFQGKNHEKSVKILSLGMKRKAAIAKLDDAT